VLYQIGEPPIDVVDIESGDFIISENVGLRSRTLRRRRSPLELPILSATYISSRSYPPQAAAALAMKAPIKNESAVKRE